MTVVALAVLDVFNAQEHYVELLVVHVSCDFLCAHVWRRGANFLA